MRVSFLGKGGSGKTTMSTSFIKYLESMNKNILAIDADINVHLGKALEIDVKFLGDSFDEVADYLESNQEAKRTGILSGLYNNFVSNTTNKAIIGTTPPTYKSNFIKSSLGDEFIKKFATRKNNTALLTVGTYTEQKVGYECYHSKLGVAVLIYNRLLDDESLFVVSDATAGVDSVGTSMFFVSDINIFVVEPTNKSLEVFKDFERITKKYNIKNYIIANKIRTNEDLEYIKSQIPEEKIIDFVKDSDSLRRYEQGNIDSLHEFVRGNDKLNEKIYKLLMSTQKDWDKYYDMVKETYTNDANDWYSKYYGEDLTKYIDHNFKYMEVINKND